MRVFVLARKFLAKGCVKVYLRSIKVATRVVLQMAKLASQDQVNCPFFKKKKKKIYSF